MSSYNELIALINGCINRNGVQAITGRVLNGVLRAMVNQLGAGYAMGGVAHPTDDPGTPEAPVCYYASEVGTYTHFGNIQIVPGELALLCFDLTDGWFKETMYEGFESVQATIDGNVGTPAVNVTYVNGVLSFDFSNMKGNTGAAAGFGNVTAAVDGTSGTPGVSVQTDGPDTAKNIAFQFTGLKGETGVTSVIATVDNTSGTPQCAVSLNGQQLTLAFTGLKGAQGDTGSSVAYPFTIVNNLTTNDPTQALSAAMGVQLEAEVSQLEAKVTDNEKKEQASSLGLQLVYPNDSTYFPYPFEQGKTYLITLVSTSVSAITMSTWPADKSAIVDRLQGMIPYETKEFTATGDADLLKASDPCTVILYEKDSIAEKLKDTGILSLSAMAQSGVTDLMSAGEYGYNIGTNQIIYKLSNTRYAASTPSNNLLYRYDGTLYYYGGSALIGIPTIANLENLHEEDDKNIRELFGLDLNKQIAYSTSFVLYQDTSHPLFDYVGKTDVRATIVTSPGVSYILRAKNKATGNDITLGTITAEQNITGTNEIFYESEGFELINMRLIGGSTASGNDCTFTWSKGNIVAENIEYVRGESTTQTFTYASNRAVIDYNFRKGRKYIITNHGPNTAVFSLTNWDGLNAGQLWNKTTISKDATVSIIAEQDCSYLRCGDYDNSPSVIISEVLLDRVISDADLLVKMDEDKKGTYLAFNYDVGGLVYPEGTYARSTATCLTGYLPYNGGDIIARGYTNQGVNLLSYYDSEHNYLGGFFGSYYNNVPVIVRAEYVPANTAFVRVTGYAKNGYSKTGNYINLSYTDSDFYYEKSKDFSGIYQFGYKANGKYNPGEIAPFPNSITDVSAWYAMYDSLMQEYPEYISKIDCDQVYATTPGAMQRPSQLEGLPIYLYKFVPYYAPSSSQAGVTETNSKRLKVFICTGTHPEYMAIYDCYKLMEAICSNWKNEDNLWDLRWNAEYYIMPVSGPWGCANASRVNYNGVDLNRNAPGSEWVLRGYGEDDYSGPTPGSEYETKVWVYFLNLINPKVFVDHHNFGGGLSSGLMYGESKFQLVRDVLAAHIVEMTMREKLKYDGIMPGINNAPLVAGYCADRETIGCTRDKYAHDRDILSCTFETNMRFNYENGEISSVAKPAYDTNACTVATDCFSNFLIRLLKAVSVNCIPDR